MRRALVISLVLHALGLAILAAAAGPRVAPPPRLPVIPVDFIPLAAPEPALVERARTEAGPRSTPAPAPAPAARPAPSRSNTRETPPSRSNARETPPSSSNTRETSPSPAPSHRDPKAVPPPVKSPAPKPGAESRLPRTGSADTTGVLQSELPRVGDLRGAMQMRVDGEIAPYAYYLSVLERKIAGCWVPPAGIDQQSGEVAAVVRFRIGKDGGVTLDTLEESSGIGPFDVSARHALDLALPLPPLPEDFAGDHLVVHLRFVYSRETGLPPGVR